MAPEDEGDPFQLDQAMRVLESTPTVLKSLVERLPDDWLDFREAPDAWSPHIVLVHLVHNERTNWIPRIRVFLSGDAVRRFAPFHQLPEEGEAVNGPVAQLIAEFLRLRRESLALLRDLDLTPERFDLEAEHPSLGRVKLRHLLATWVVHDLNHLHQITKSVAKRYQASVGPWRRYLGILDS